jgi:vacuolar-type H+-ATPase subunit D/Vma8
MSERIGRLCDELRIKLHGMDRRLEALKSNGAATFDQSQDVLESQLDRVEQRIYDNRMTVEAANVRVKTWLAEQKARSVTGRALWTERHKAHRLEIRVDDAEVYAIAVFELAAAAADEATLAVLQAPLARNDADVAVLCETEPL